MAWYIQCAEWEKYAAKNTWDSAKLSVRIGETKSFPDKEKLKEFMTTKAAFQKILKGTLWVGKKDQKGTRKWQTRKEQKKSS